MDSLNSDREKYVEHLLDEMAEQEIQIRELKRELNIAQTQAEQAIHYQMETQRWFFRVWH
jgi:hypothetical protein